VELSEKIEPDDAEAVPRRKMQKDRLRAWATKPRIGSDATPRALLRTLTLRRPSTGCALLAGLRHGLRDPFEAIQLGLSAIDALRLAHDALPPLGGVVEE
jgi:hypothetical protein